MTDPHPNRNSQAMQDWYWLTAEAEAEDRREAENDDHPTGYRPGRMIGVTLALLAASVIGALVLEYYLRGAS